MKAVYCRRRFRDALAERRRTLKPQATGMMPCATKLYIPLTHASLIIQASPRSSSNQSTLLCAQQTKPTLLAPDLLPHPQHRLRLRCGKRLGCLSMKMKTMTRTRRLRVSLPSSLRQQEGRAQTLIGAQVQRDLQVDMVDMCRTLECRIQMTCKLEAVLPRGTHV